MGGYGSGRRPTYSRNVVECCRSLDVNRLYKVGCLVPDQLRDWGWKHDGEVVASISMQAEEDLLILSFDYRRRGEKAQSVEQAITIEWVPCHFGGTRPYFRCSGVVNGAYCGRRVTKLLLQEKFFLCRRCHQLTYASQSEGTFDRLLRRANKLKVRLGGEPGLRSPIPPRPKGMWRRTYARLRSEAFETDQSAYEIFALREVRLLERSDHAKKTKGFWE